MLYVRADGSAETGAGHMMRCLTVADEIPDRREVCFLCGDNASAAFAVDRGYGAQVLSARPFSAEEAEEICRFIRNRAALAQGGDCLVQGSDFPVHGGGFRARPVLLADSYLIMPAYVEALSGCCDVALFDDMAEEPFFAARWVVNYNFFADRERYMRLYGGRTETAFLTGAAYIPLRPQFRACRLPNPPDDVSENGSGGGTENRPESGQESRPESGPRRILITAGGGDHRNIAGAILERLMREEKLRETELHVVCGAFHPDLEKLQHLARQRDMIYIHQNVRDMAGLMARCGAAVTAGGTTVYELCAVGVPLIAFSYADNQEALVRYVGEHGLGIDAGEYRAGSREVLRRIRDGVLRLLEEPQEAKRLRQAAVERVDGCGAGRIAGAIYGIKRGYGI